MINDVPVRVTEVPDARGVIVAEAGTLGTPRHMDILADHLATQGFTTVALGPLAHADHVGEHAARIQSVVELARAEHPNLPLGVVGSSLGADSVLFWRGLHGTSGTPVVALNPVILEKMLPWGDRVKVGASLLSSRLGLRHVGTPMSLGIPLTDNPASLEFAGNLVNPSSMTVESGLFGDTAKMAGSIAAHSRGDHGAVAVALAGADQVALNLASKGMAKLLGAEVWKVPGAAHDLSQLAGPEVATRIADFVLMAAR